LHVVLITQKDACVWLVAGARYQDMNRVTNNFRRRGLLQKENPKDPATQEEALSHCTVSQGAWVQPMEVFLAKGWFWYGSIRIKMSGLKETVH
jgi:hypothetical protein